MMKMEDAVRQRHTVRKYLDKPIPKSFVRVIEERMEMLNRMHNLKMSLVTDNKTGFSVFFRLVLAHGVRNYFILEGPESEHLYEDIGYAGADLMLFIQSLGLNTWWVGGTYSKMNAKNLSQGEHVLGILVLGYGAVQGKPHKSKSLDEVASYQGMMPSWFTSGAEAALLAPTALNLQPFKIEGAGNKVRISVSGGLMSRIDLGIIKYFFELGAGKENFTYTDKL